MACSPGTIADLIESQELVAPVDDACVCNILHIEVEWVEEESARGVANAEHPSVQHLPSCLFFDERLRSDEFVLKVDFALLDCKFADLQAHMHNILPLYTLSATDNVPGHTV